MNKKKLRKRLSLVIITASLVTILVLTLWFLNNAAPIISKLSDLNLNISNSNLKKEYASYDNMIESINDIQNQYLVIFTIKDIDGNELTNNKVNHDLPVFTKMVKIDNNPYLLTAYSKRDMNISDAFIELFFFQIIVVVIILFVTFLCTRQIIIKPVDKIINDIRNYKLGKKPVKMDMDGEFALIQNEFVKLTDELDKEKEEQNRIIASISHDIKTPLTSIIGYSNLIQDDNITQEEIKKYNNKISEKALHIKDVLYAFDDYLVNHEKITLKLDSIQIKDLVKELNNDYKIELENKNISFEVSTNCENKYINIDVLKIKRVFSNMISNSIRYLKDGGNININIITEDKNTKFIIADNGPGVDEEIINKIFDPLFTTDYSRKISGLGLSIVKEFVQIHSGDIKAYNNNGLVIEFNIPDLKDETNK